MTAPTRTTDSAVELAIAWEIEEAKDAILLGTVPGLAIAHLDAALSALSRRDPQPETRNAHQYLESICQLAEEQLAVSRRILAALGSSSDSRSSIELMTSTRGVDVASKAYEGSSTDGLVDQAVGNYFATIDAVQQRLNGSPKVAP